MRCDDFWCHWLSSPPLLCHFMPYFHAYLILLYILFDFYLFERYLLFSPAFYDIFSCFSFDICRRHAAIDADGIAFFFFFFTFLLSAYLHIFAISAFCLMRRHFHFFLASLITYLMTFHDYIDIFRLHYLYLYLRPIAPLIFSFAISIDAPHWYAITLSIFIDYFISLFIIMLIFFDIFDCFLWYLRFWLFIILWWCLFISRYAIYYIIIYCHYICFAFSSFSLFMPLIAIIFTIIVSPFSDICLSFTIAYISLIILHYYLFHLLIYALYISLIWAFIFTPPLFCLLWFSLTPLVFRLGFLICIVFHWLRHYAICIDAITYLFIYFLSIFHCHFLFICCLLHLHIYCYYQFTHC